MNEQLQSLVVSNMQPKNNWLRWLINNSSRFAARRPCDNYSADDSLWQNLAYSIRLALPFWAVAESKCLAQQMSRASKCLAQSKCLVEILYGKPHQKKSSTLCTPKNTCARIEKFLPKIQNQKVSVGTIAQRPIFKRNPHQNSRNLVILKLYNLLI